jgi:catechol 2,3-dioxygenase-like lactoylglutathione lyase family enzyme
MKLRHAILSIIALALAGPVVTRAQPVPTQSAAPEPLVSAVESVGFTVSDLDAAVEWYTRVLDFRVLDRAEHAGEALERSTGVFGSRVRTARLSLGDERLELVEYLAPQGRPIPPDWRSHDHWFQHIAIVVPDVGRAYRHLREHGVRHASAGPQRLPDWNPNAGGISAFYFKDPDGHVLEVISFPPGKGDPRWHNLAREHPGRMFLGIDHTAIVVSDTEESLGLYRDVLGLTVAGASENFGVEQERLNNVFRARLRITALRAPRGPGIEFLEYLAPSDGRPAPTDTRACDLWHWTINLAAGDDAEARLRGRTSWVTPGTVNDPTGRRVIAIRDRDGHELRGIQGVPSRAAAPSSQP